MNYNIKWFDTIDSTNSKMACDKNSLKEGSVYAAHIQTAGRGQRGNRWESGKDVNLTFSILYKPNSLTASKQFAISEAVTLGITDYLETIGIKSKIKWPNDIYSSDFKICGILIENAIANDNMSEPTVSSSIVGIGLNVNQTIFPEGLSCRPSSMKLLSGRHYSLTEELGRLLSFIGKRYDTMICVKSLERMEKEYVSRLYRLGEWHEFEEMEATAVPTEYRSGKPFRGRITGISETARLLIEKEDGMVGEYSFKEIKYLIQKSV